MASNPFNVFDPSPTGTFWCLIFDNGTTSGGYSNRRYLDFTLTFEERFGLKESGLLDRVVAIGRVVVDKKKHLESIGIV